jgi:hypothetical protein
LNDVPRQGGVLLQKAGLVKTTAANGLKWILR